ncbi:MAG: DUF819 family protein [Deltaproteobacteria bacterium]|nr:MAG: DUF819 family protein [Deltaproteobacteria bacterium]
MIILQIATFLLLPALFIMGERRFKWMAFFGTVVWSYLAGILMAMLIPNFLNSEVTNRIVEVSVLLAVPLLLFSLDVRAWLSNTRTTIISFVLSLLSISISAAVFSFILRGNDSETWKMGGMLVGVYSGGTVNMSAIGKSLEISEEKFLLLNTADIIISSLYMFFVLMVAKRFLALFLPQFQGEKGEETEFCENLNINKREYGVAFGLALLVCGLSVGLTMLFMQKMFAPLILLLSTSLGIGFSFNSKIRENKASYKMGEYILYIFCVGLGSLCDLNQTISNAPHIFLFVSVTLVVAIVLHFIGAWLFKIDVDTALITNVAAVYGPAFVGPVARVLGNRQIVVSGLTCGLMGYAVGNYLGLGMAQLIRLLLQ